MDPERLRALLQAVQAGDTSITDALRELRELPFRTLEFARVDTHRHLRTGFPEVVLGQGKTPEQIAAILVELASAGSTALATRVSPAAAELVLAAVPAARYLPVPRAIVRRPDSGARPRPRLDRGGQRGNRRHPGGRGGGADRRAGGQPRRAPVRRRRRGDPPPARAAARVIEQAEVAIVVAGMEGALPSVVAGLFARPVIAVPTSVGYGASLGGIAALLSMLNSCAAGIAVVNIDNGFGAGQMAAMLNRKRDS